MVDVIFLSGFGISASQIWKIALKTTHRPLEYIPDEIFSKILGELCTRVCLGVPIKFFWCFPSKNLLLVSCVFITILGENFPIVNGTSLFPQKIFSDNLKRKNIQNIFEDIVGIISLRRVEWAMFQRKWTKIEKKIAIFWKNIPGLIFHFFLKIYHPPQSDIRSTYQHIFFKCQNIIFLWSKSIKCV